MLIRPNWRTQYLDFIYLDRLRGAVMFDIGARQGETAEKFAPYVKTIHCFEPNREDFDVLCKTVRNENILCWNYAMWNKECALRLDDTRGSGESVTTVNGKGYECTATTIDSFSAQHNESPEFIKIDTEGAELEILQGGVETIKRARPQLAVACYHNMHQAFEVMCYLHNMLVDYKFHCANYSNGKPQETILYAIPI